MNKILIDFYNNIAKKKAYWMPILFFATLAYGFSIFNRTVSIDNLRMDDYIGNGNIMIAATRWGMVLWVKLLSQPIFMPFVRKFLAVIFLACGSTLLACVAYSLLKLKHVWTYTIFSSTIVVYPLINEIFEYDVANMVVGGNLVLTAVAILFLETTNVGCWKKMLVPTLLLLPVVSSYEAGAFVYVTAVFILLFCKYIIVQKSISKISSYLAEGLRYAVPLLIAIILRIIIGFILIKLYKLEYLPNGDTHMAWFNGNLSFGRIISIFASNIDNYFISGLIYLPITIFAFTFVIFIIGVIGCAIHKPGMLPIIAGGGVILSLFLLSIVQCDSLNYRAAQNITIFVAFVMAWSVEVCQNSKYCVIQNLAIIGGLWLCLQQSTCLNQFLALNNQRSNNEIAIVQQIGYTLKSSFEDKPVVFVGEYDMGSWINQQICSWNDTIGRQCYNKIRLFVSGKNSEVSLSDSATSNEGVRFIQSNVDSLLTWAVGSTDQIWVKRFFSYCGYDITTMHFTGRTLKDYTDIARKENMKPFEIRDMGDYILVCIGELDMASKGHSESE